MYIHAREAHRKLSDTFARSEEKTVYQFARSAEKKQILFFHEFSRSAQKQILVRAKRGEKTNINSREARRHFVINFREARRKLKTHMHTLTFKRILLFLFSFQIFLPSTVPVLYDYGSTTVLVL